MRKDFDRWNKTKKKLNEDTEPGDSIKAQPLHERSSPSAHGAARNSLAVAVRSPPPHMKRAATEPPFLLFADRLLLRLGACLGVVPFAPAFGTAEWLLHTAGYAEHAREFSINFFPLLDQLLYSCNSFVDDHLLLLSDGEADK